MSVIIGSIQIAKKTKTAWDAQNPTLLAGQVIAETDAGKTRIKVGDGATGYATLKYITVKDTDEVSEGAVNLWYTNARVEAHADTLYYRKATVDGMFADAVKTPLPLDCNANPNYPAATKGTAYKVSVAGKIGGASGVDVEVGDLLIASIASASGDHATVGSNWGLYQTNIDKSTEGVFGTARRATTTEGNSGTDDVAYMTSLKVKNFGDGRYLQLAGGTISGSLAGTSNTFTVADNTVVTQLRGVTGKLQISGYHSSYGGAYMQSIAVDNSVYRSLSFEASGFNFNATITGTKATFNTGATNGVSITNSAYSGGIYNVLNFGTGTAITDVIGIWGRDALNGLVYSAKSTGFHSFRVNNTEVFIIGETSMQSLVPLTGTSAVFSQANPKSLTGAWQISALDLTSSTTGVGGGVTFTGYKTGTTALEYFAAIDGYKENGAGGDASGAFRILTQQATGAGLVERLRVTSTGNVGIGTITPTALGGYKTLEIKGTTEGGALISNYNDVVKAALLTNSALEGNVGTITNHHFKIRTNSIDAITIATNQLLRAHAYGAGTLTTDASGNITASSDERLKNIKGVFNRGLSDLMKVTAIVYKWNKLSGMEMKSTYAGFSADNVKQAIPEAVSKDNRGYLTLSDRPILATTVNAIKELKHEIDGLKKILAANNIAIN